MAGCYNRTAGEDGGNPGGQGLNSHHGHVKGVHLLWQSRLAAGKGCLDSCSLGAQTEPPAVGEVVRSRSRTFWYS